jgi:ComEC/Rec2-related protein
MPGRGPRYRRAAMPWLPFVALGLVLGACAPTALTLWWLWAGLAGAALAVLAQRYPLAARWAGCAAAAAIGTALASPGASPPAGASRLVEVRGTVSSVRWQGFNQGFSMHDARAVLPADWLPPGRLFVRSPGAPGVRPGDAVTVRGVWAPDERGEAVRAVALDVTAREAGPRGGAWRALDRLAEHRELAGALLLGRGDPPERDDFRNSGLAHVLAVSGMHLAIAAGLAWWLLRALGVGWGGRLLALGLLVVGYTWLTAASPATVRACAMSLAVIACSALGREPHRLGPVSLAALVLVLWDPTMARDIGFQLSLAAVLGIVTVGLDLVQLRERLMPLRAWPLDRPLWRILLWLGRAASDSLIIGLAATLATAPLVAWHFGAVAPWSWLTSLVAGLPATIALWAGLPLLLGAGLWPGGPWEGLYRLVEWNLDALAGCAAWSARHLPQQPSDAPSALLLCAWPMLFLRLRDGWDLLLRLAAAGALLLVW